MTEIYLDIETIPSQVPAVKDAISADAQEEIKALSAPKSYKKPEAIEEWMSDKKAEILNGVEEKYARCGLDGATNHIVCIGIHIEGHFPVTFSDQGKDALAEEQIILQKFFNYLEERVKSYQKPVFVGHNIVGFDLKIVKQRSIVLGIKPPECIPFNTKPWDANPYDTMAQWDAKSFVSLDKICKALSLPGKGDITGSDVYRLWREGKIDEIAEYCAQDVAKVRQVHKRMTFQTLDSEASWLAA